MSKILKRFPATVSLEEETFLNNKKINAELYAFLQSHSYPDPETGETRVYRKNQPSQKDMAEKIFNVSRNTINNHIKALQEHGFLIDNKTYYVLPPKEQVFFQIDLKLLEFFIDTVKEPVIKTYIYLGQRFKYKGSDYVFTKQEIAKHIGLGDSLNYSGTYKKINNYLYVLESFGLIKLAYFYEDKTPLIRLVDFKNEPPQ